VERDGLYWRTSSPRAAESFEFEMSAQATAGEMTSWQQWVQRPQRLWIRRAFFQIHLWAGIGVGIYVVAISISGSALVFRHELTRSFSRKVVVLADSGRRMSVEELTEHAQRAYLTYEVDNVREAETPDGPDYVVLERAHKRIERLFDPYTGADLGNAHSAVERTLTWLADLHDNLLGGRTGRYVNGIGSCLVTLLSLTGAILWWPGIKNWRRSTTVSWKAHFPRLNWDLHSAMGLFLSWIAQLHFGRFNALTESLWTLFGLVPGISALTGALMWWNRVLRKKFRHPYRQAEGTGTANGAAAKALNAVAGATELTAGGNSSNCR